MADVAFFVQAPSEELLDKCTREQLFKIAEHYRIDIPDRRVKDATIQNVLFAALCELGILSGAARPPQARLESLAPLAASASDLTFEQQKELLLLQLEHAKTLKSVEIEKQIAVEKLRYQTEQAKLSVEQSRLELLRAGFSGGAASGAQESSSVRPGGGGECFDVLGNLRLLPKFNERDPESFFSLFERVAESRKWPESARTVMLQCALTGRAQEAYSALSVADGQDYECVKSAVLKVYELVPEAYRQRFRSWKRVEKQTHLEFARDLTGHFARWCAALKVETFEDLSELIVLEQFKNSIPENIAQHINDLKVRRVSEAASVADDYVLTHKRSFGEWRAHSGSRGGPFAERAEAALGSYVGRSGKSDARERNSRGFEKTCSYCLKRGHFRADCYALKPRVPQGGPMAQPKGACCAVSLPRAPAVSEVGVPARGESVSVGLASFLPFISGGHVSLVGGRLKVPVNILRDTAAFDSFIQASVLPFSAETHTGCWVPVVGMEMNVLQVPLHKITLHSDLFQGEIAVGVRPALPVEGVTLILGNGAAGERVWGDVAPSPVVSSVPLVRKQPDEDEISFPEVFTACAVTRSMSQHSPPEPPECGVGDGEAVDGLCFSLSDVSLSVTQEELESEQRADASLKGPFDMVLPASEVKKDSHCYFLLKGLLMRKWVPHGDDFVGDPVLQIVLPSKLRETVLRWAHDDSGHWGVRKTYNRVLKHFFWPKLKRDVSEYVKTCHTCQLAGKPNQVIKPAPLFPIPAVGQPFEHLIIDCVGPLPRSKSGAVYLLTVMCQTTRYPAAYPLRTITARSVVRALTQFIAIFGIPKVIQTDRGSNFTSHLFSQVLKQLGVKHNKASAYHAQSQGALERFHQSLKSLLRTYCVKLDGDWEEGLPWLLLAAREVSQESTGFSPNDLVFGHNVRGPLDLLCEQWKDAAPPENVLDYVNGFRHRLYAAGVLAKKNLGTAQSKMKTLYDRRAEKRVFSEGDRVLALLPIITSPFQAKYGGPYEIKKKTSEHNYIIATPDRRRSVQMCHVNLLKPYYERVPPGEAVSASSLPARPVCSVSRVSVVYPPQSVPAGVEDGLPDADAGVQQGRLKNSESLNKLHLLLGHLSESQQADLVEVISSFPSLFGDTPTQTNVIEHDIDVGDALPIRQRFYRFSPEKRVSLDAEVKYMLDNCIAVPSFSSWASPCILVPKPDKTFRFCTDFRKLNAVTKPDSFPLPRMEDCVDQVGHAAFVSKFDLLKGYWQVPLSERARDLSAFITPNGLFSYNVMPFGLRNAPATFQRLMTRVLGDLEGCTVYLDDVVVVSDSWPSHVERVRALFLRLAEARLTINLAKCEFARATVTYLGRVVGQGKVRPVAEKIRAVQFYPLPTTKKELMRFLGLVGYYRGFCRNFSEVVAPLTDLLKMRVPFVWSPLCQQAFERIKSLLCEAPVLAAPRFDRPFVLQVDASHIGVGGVLLQANELGLEKPVCFFSKKFNSYQLNYSTIEKEALALVWALRNFEVYLGSGAVPVVVYTDHNPLLFLNSLQCPNQRLIRWSLFLQSHWLDIRHIKGAENVVADALSRVPQD
uniref:Gypsy retrotransposon integrase-like protein 1 n=1 Tax=Gadus morhua TaxID=8049 RepID=A0A8C5CMY1_GADMO